MILKKLYKYCILIVNLKKKKILAKPDEFLHLFVVNNDQLEKYLLFLKSLKNIPNERVIINRLLEYYLEKYAEYYNKN